MSTVDVIMGTYNQECYIAQALESVLSQNTKFPVTIHVADDGSTDKTPEIVQNYYGRYPNRIVPALDKKNRGLFDKDRMFLQLLRDSRADYIALLEGDDYWTDPYKLQKQVDYLDTHPNCAISFHNAIMKYEDDDSKSCKFHTAEIEPIIDIAQLISKNLIPTASSVFRKKALSTIPDYYCKIVTGDWFLHLLLIQHGTADYIDKVMSVYRIHSGGIARDRVRIHDSVIKMFRYFSNNLSSDLAPVLQEAIKNHSSLLIEELIKRITQLMEWGKYRQAAGCFDTIRCTVAEFKQVLIDVENRALLIKAKKEIENNHIAIAEKYLSDALTEGEMAQKTRSDFVLALGDCYQNCKNYEKAKALYSDEIATGSLTEMNKFGPLLRLGSLLTADGDFSAAESAYEECLNVNNIPESKLIDGLLALSLCRKKQGNYKEAMQSLIKITKLDALSEKQKFQTHSNIGDIYKINNEFEKAIDYYEKCIKIESISTKMQCDTVLSLVQCYKQLKNTQQAMDKLIRIAGFDHLSERIKFQINFDLGNIYKSINELDKAIDYFLKCIKIESISTEMHCEAVLSLGQCYDLKNSNIKAEETYTSALSDTNPEIYKFKILLRLGMLYIRQKDYSKAQLFLNRAIGISGIADYERQHAIRGLDNIPSIYRNISNNEEINANCTNLKTTVVSNTEAIKKCELEAKLNDAQRCAVDLLLKSCDIVDKIILEVGSDIEGVVAQYLAAKGGYVVATNTSPHFVDHIDNERISYRSYDCQRLNLKENSIDIIFSVNTFEHVLDLPSALKELYRVLKPEGILVTLFGPIWSSPKGHHLWAKFGNEIVSFWNPKLRNPIEDFSHLLFTPEQMKDDLYKKGENSNLVKEIVNAVYYRDDINRLFYEDYINIFNKSPFLQKSLEHNHEYNINMHTDDKLKKIHGTKNNYRVSSFRIVLFK
jgi:tetratricopeptide (TPR) repeat protein